MRVHDGIKSVLVYDDLRFLKQACTEANATRLLEPHRKNMTFTLVRPFRHDGFKLTADHDNVFDVIARNSPFDLWILDNDLAPGLEGFDFFQEVIDKTPWHLPKRLVSCSANLSRRRDIESYFDNWCAVHRPKD